jgi:hypothetical protein
MEILHLLRSRPNETVGNLIVNITNGDRSRVVELFEDDVDWAMLVDDIMSSDKVICWW